MPARNPRRHDLNVRDHHGPSPHEKQLLELEKLEAANQYSFIDYCERMEPIWEAQKQDYERSREEWKLAHPNRFRRIGNGTDDVEQSITDPEPKPKPAKAAPFKQSDETLPEILIVRSV